MTNEIINTIIEMYDFDYYSPSKLEIILEKFYQGKDFSMANRIAIWNDVSNKLLDKYK